MNKSAVLDLRRDQKHMTTVPGADPALVDDRPGAGIALEFKLPRKKVAIEHVECGGDKPGGIDHRTGPDDDAARIDQEYAAVGEELTEDRRRVLAHHAIHYRARRRLLDKTGQLAGADRKALPIDDRAWRIGDAEGTTVGTLQRRCATDDLRTRGIREYAGRVRKNELDAGRNNR